MGLIKAITGAAGGALADQWKEFFYCEAISKDVLVTKGQKMLTGRSSNTKGNDNIISNGSGIAVADGQCMIIVEQGKVVEVCAEPGEYTYDTSTEPSIFTGGLGQGIKNTFKTIGKRFTYGGDTGKDQRVYYFNTKEIIDNKFGTPTPIPFRVVDSKIGLDVDISVRCNGIYTYKIADPLLFYTNVCGNVQSEYEKAEIAETLKSELLTYLAPAFARISELEVRPNQIPSKNIEIRDALKSELTHDWAEIRGLEIVNISFNSISIPKEDEQMIKEAQRVAVMRDPTMAAATLVGAQSEAMKSAASNPNGAMMGFMGMGMAQQAGGMNTQNLYAMGQQQQQQAAAQPSPQQTAAQPSPQQTAADGGWTCECGQSGNSGKFCSGCGKPKPEPKPAAGTWTCSCGTVNKGKFCMECGKNKPDEGWTCSCGAVNKGKFCPECGKPKPAGEPLYQCDKCGWKPEDPKNPPKFCPECGDPFDDNDIK
ncbi:SPFH domain-containing protein [Ruminococcus sp. Marseille-P6503]|uniref:SPFH domain-containing protein n=1 Tax=Ruminococcus sp. Marseille-P6503 TaxID=2364796 RepID=UPI000F546B55|nr:SPFH domain-containing protein [Ruminococcus sp. Marseille-P6503]